MKKRYLLFIPLYLFSFLILFIKKQNKYHFPLVVFMPPTDKHKIFKRGSNFTGLIIPDLSTRFNVNKNCNLCSFTVRNRHIPNSTPNDIIFSSMFLKSFNLIPSLRSLRTTGSKCGVIIFTDSILYQKINHVLFTFLNDCGCLIINVGELSTSRKNKLFMARNLAIYEFLLLNYQYINRIIIIDLYDTIFQGDPFNNYFLNDTIGLSLETTKIQGSHIQGISILFGQEKAHQLCYKRKIINCGTIIGSSQIVLNFLSLFMEFANNLSETDFNELVNTQFPDQAIVNALICGKVLDERNMKYHLYTVHDEYVSLHKIYRNK